MFAATIEAGASWVGLRAGDNFEIHAEHVQYVQHTLKFCGLLTPLQFRHESDTDPGHGSQGGPQLQELSKVGSGTPLARS